MVIRAVVLDIGGVLEITPDLGVHQRWETQLGLPPGEIDARLRDVWQGGSVGTIALDDVHEASGTASVLMPSSSRSSWLTCGASTSVPPMPS
jgi:hypothetical protein